MRIIVTGGAGFIGSAFLLRHVPAHPEHHFVTVDKLTYAANPASLAPLESANNHELLRVDIARGDDVDRLFDDVRPDAVVHLAAESHVDRSIVGPDTFIETNVVGTFRLLEAARRRFRDREGGVFLHVSTDEVYGSLGPTGAFTEESRYDPSSPYSASKASSDHLVRAYHRTYGLPTRITNCSNNYGPRQFPEKLVPLMILSALERKPLPVYGDGENVRDWLYVDDHVRALWDVLLRGKNGETYNIGGNAERRNIDLVRTLCRVVAEETGATESALGALVTFVRDRPGHDRRYAIDARKLREELGWAPVESFESGLAKTVRWYLANEAWVAAVKTGEYLRWIELHYGPRKPGGSA